MGDNRTTPTIGSVIKQLSDRVGRLERRSTGLPTYTLATRPAASAVKVGTPIFVSDAVDGQRFQGSDGTNWKTLG